MALDDLGNYYAALPDEVRGSGTGSINGIGIGAGAPDASTKVNAIYIDSVTGAIYTNPTKVAGAWINSGSAVGTGNLVAYTSGTPANPADISKPALAYDPNGFLPIVGWDTVGHTWSV